MGIEIILYDPSPVVQKIFFHILYHYNPIVHRIDQTSKLVEKIQYSKPDIIFIDNSFSQDSNLINTINEKQESLKKIPIILMSNTTLNQEAFQPTKAQDFLKKPIEAGKLRSLIDRFVPKIKSNILAQHLKFPPVPDFQEDTTPKTQPSSEMQNINTPNEKFSSSMNLETDIDPITLSEYENTQHMSPDDLQQLSQKPAHSDDDIQPDITPEEHEEEKQHISPNDLQQLSQKPAHSDDDIQPDITPEEHEEEKQHISPNDLQQLSQKPAHSDDDIQPDITPEEHEEEKQHISPNNLQQLSQKPAHSDDDIQPTPLSENEEKDQHSNLSKESTQTTQKIKKSETNVKILKTFLKSDQVKKIDKNISEDLEKNKNIKKWINEQVKTEVEKQLTKLIEHSSKKIIQQIAEKAVWQVVPDLSKQMITRELNKLLKEENTEESMEEDIEK